MNSRLTRLDARLERILEKRANRLVCHGQPPSKTRGGIFGQANLDFLVNANIGAPAMISLVKFKHGFFHRSQEDAILLPATVTAQMVFGGNQHRLGLG